MMLPYASSSDLDTMFGEKNEEFRTYSEIVPQEYQHALMFWRDQERIGAFEIGDIALVLIRRAAEQGLAVSKSEIYRAVGKFAGRERTTILYYAQVADFFDDAVRQEYEMLSFSAFAFARRMGPRWREVLEFAKSKPYVTGADLESEFVLDLADYASQNTSGSAASDLTSLLSASANVQDAEDAYSHLISTLYSLKDELKRIAAYPSITPQTKADLKNLIALTEKVLPKIALEAGALLADEEAEE